MAWTSSNRTLCHVPFVITEITVAPDSTDATAVAHGGPSTLAPDFVVVEQNTANPTGHEITVTDKGTTNVTFDVQNSGSTFKAYCFFIHQARQDGQSINSDNEPT